MPMKRKREEAFPMEILYQRTPLRDGGGIRLLRLHAAESPEENLEGNLEIHDGRDEYEALSYTWGSPFSDYDPNSKDDTKAIVRIVSQDQAYKIPITTNLAAALKCLRYEDADRLLWVDALSINQKSDTEKSVQVPRIASIFSKASKVRVWLGEEAQNSGEALKFIRRILNLDDFDRLVQNEREDIAWAAVFNLMRRSWFSRRWVVQEIALAKSAEIHCGPHTVDWKEFADAVALFASRHQDLKRLFKLSKKFDHHPDYLGDITALGANRLCSASANLFRRADEGGTRSNLLSLEALVSILPAFEASHSHDTIYAVLALAQDARISTSTTYLAPPTPIGGEKPDFPFPSPAPSTDEFFRPTHRRRASTSLANSFREKAEGFEPANPLEEVMTPKDQATASRAVHRIQQNLADRTYHVDYTKSFFEVCQDFLKFTFRRSSSLDIICRPWAPTHNTKEVLPSWIPTLDGAAFKPNARGIFSRVKADPLVGMPDRQRTYSAAGKYPLAYKFGEEPNSKSLHVDGFVLDEVGHLQLPAQEGIVPYGWMEAAGWKDLQSDPPERFWRTLVADRSPEGLNPPSYYRRACKYAYELRPVGGPLNTERLIINNCPEIVAEFLRRVQSVIWMRVLFSTKQDRYLGMAPDKARSGDLVCILYGCSVPVILRRIEGATGKGSYYYEFIGECYLHGMMDGEASKAKQDGGIITTRFELR